jgi:predicted nucleic acid-binding protein
MANAGYPNALPVQAVIKHLADARDPDLHEFWTDEISLLDGDTIDRSRIHGPRQITDIYLLALATSRGGRFVTFDGKIPLAAVRQATQKNLLVL